MTAPFLVAALGVAVVPVVEHLARGAYGAGVAGFVATGLSATLALVGAAWRRESSPGRAGGWVAGWITAGALSALACGGAESVPVVSRMALAGAWFLFGLRAASARGAAVGLIVAGIAAAGLAIWQVSGGLSVPEGALATLDRLDPALAERVRARLAEPRGFAFFVYPNALGGFLILVLPFAAAWRATGGGGAATAALAALAAGLVASGSIGAAGCLLVAALLARPRGGRFRLSPAIILAAVAVLAAVLLLRPGSAASGGISGRAGLILAAVRPVSAAGAIIGAGPGRWGEVLRARVADASWSRHAHNWLAETWVELGFAGLAALLLALRGPFAGARRALASADPWTRATAAAWVAGGLHALIDIDYALPALIGPWWFLAGRLALPESPVARSRRAAPGRVPGWLWPALGLAVVACLRGPAAGTAAGALSGGAVAWLWYRRVVHGDSPGVTRADGPALAMLALGGWWAVASPSPDRTLVTLLEIAGWAGCVVAVRRLVADGPAESRLRTAVIALGCGFAGWAIVESLATGTRGRGPFPSPNTLASWLACAAALAAGSLRVGGRALGIGAVLAAGLLATDSTGGLVAGVVGAAVAVGARIRARRSIRLRVALIALAAAAVVFALQRRDDASGLSPRWTMWREAAILLAHDPSGHGPGRYGDAVAAVRLPSSTSAGVGRYSLAAPFAHCEPLQFAVEWGMVPLGVLVWGVVGVWRGADPRRRAWLFALVAPGLHGLVDFPFRAPPVALLTAVALGVATARRAVPTGSALRVAPLPFAVAIWCAIAFGRPAMSRLALGAGRPDLGAASWGLSADAAIESGRAWARRAFDAAGPGPALARAEESLRRAVALGGGRWTDRLDLGRFLQARGARTGTRTDLDGAELELARATTGAPWSTEAWIARADLAIARRRWREADAHLDEALRREPFCIAAAPRRARIEVRRGDAAGARRTLSAAIVLQAHALQRPGLNDYERWLLATPDAAQLRRDLIGVGSPR